MRSTSETFPRKLQRNTYLCANGSDFHVCADSTISPLGQPFSPSSLQKLLGVSLFSAWPFLGHFCCSHLPYWRLSFRAHSRYLRNMAVKRSTAENVAIWTLLVLFGPLFLAISLPVSITLGLGRAIRLGFVTFRRWWANRRATSFPLAQQPSVARSRAALRRFAFPSCIPRRTCRATGVLSRDFGPN